MRAGVVGAAVVIAAMSLWSIATAATPNTHRLTLAGGESAHVDCEEDAMRMDRLPNEPLAVVLYCYDETTPADGNGQWMAKTK